MGIKIKSNRFSIGTYNKRNSLLFHNVRMPYLFNNITSRIFYTALVAESLRIDRTKSACNAVTTSFKYLLNRAKNHATILKGILSKYFEVF